MERIDTPRSIDVESERALDASPLASCFWCERRHPAEHPLAVCPTCSARYSVMRLLEMSGSYPLSDEAIDEAMTRTSPGNYALGYMDGDTFSVFYVGRSDTDVKQRLHDWVGLPSSAGAQSSRARSSWGVHRGGPFPVDAPALAWARNVDSRYTRFAYSYASVAEDAYAKEWRNYDAFGGSRGLDNDSQPVSNAA